MKSRTQDPSGSLNAALVNSVQFTSLQQHVVEGLSDSAFYQRALSSSQTVISQPHNGLFIFVSSTCRALPVGSEEDLGLKVCQSLGKHQSTTTTTETYDCFLCQIPSLPLNVHFVLSKEDMKSSPHFILSSMLLGLEDCKLYVPSSFDIACYWVFASGIVLRHWTVEGKGKAVFPILQGAVVGYWE